MSTTATAKIKLSDDERKRLRWTDAKTGYVAFADFGPRVSIMRSEAFTTQGAAEAWIERLADRDFYAGRSKRRIAVLDVHLISVDPMGNELERIF